MVPLASVIQAPRCGATVCRSHCRLDAKCTFYCGGNYVCNHILGAYIMTYIIATVHMRLRNIISNKNECYFVLMHMFNANTIHNCMQLKLRDEDFTKRNNDYVAPLVGSLLSNQ